MKKFLTQLLLDLEKLATFVLKSNFCDISQFDNDLFLLLH